MNEEEAIRETLRSRVDLAIRAYQIGKEMIRKVSQKVDTSPYLSQEEKEDLLKKIKEEGR